jgi:hypothetical protein
MKFPYYTLAQMYALTTKTPIAIMFGATENDKDSAYWAVEKTHEPLYKERGFSLIAYVNV